MLSDRQLEVLQLVEAAQQPIDLPVQTARALERRGYVERALGLWRVTDAGRTYVEKEHRHAAHEAAMARLLRHEDYRQARAWGERVAGMVRALHPGMDWHHVHDIQRAAEAHFCGLDMPPKWSPGAESEENLREWAERIGEILSQFDEQRGRAKMFGRTVKIDFVADVGGAVERAGRRERVARATDGNIIDLGKLAALGRGGES